MAALGWLRQRLDEGRDREAARRHSAARLTAGSAPRRKFRRSLRYVPGRRWRPSSRRGWNKVVVGGAVIVLAVFTIAFFWGIGAVIAGDATMIGLGDSCGPGTTCHLFSWVFFSLVPIAATIVWVFIVRLDRIRFHYRRRAYERPDRLLETELLTHSIVGRDHLCEIIQRDLQSRWETSEADESAAHRVKRWIRWMRDKRRRGGKRRRPIVLVGGVGSGKTAVLARLTQWLAERGAVPVPIRLRKAQHDDSLDLLKLAHEQFMREAPVMSAAEADKIWRRLKENDQLVIIADGLEEALMDVQDTRETAIRDAFEKVARDDVALVVTSRPHGALQHLDAVMVPLEPLEVQAALDYITSTPTKGSRPTDGKRVVEIKDIVRCAELTDMPLFMRFARELHATGGLESLDANGSDRLRLRVRLIERWVELLVAGKIKSAEPVKRERREKVIEELEKIATFGLMNDSLEVTFKDYTESHGPGGDGGRTPTGADVKETLDTGTEALRAFAADAERLGLVYSRPEGLLFRHSVTQAYLGSCRISALLSRRGDKPDKVDKLTEQLEQSLLEPGRELLMALAMSCAAEDEEARTRAIRLLLRHVDDRVEKEKAVFTATAVMAAAAASTDHAAAIPGPSPNGNGGAPHERRSTRRMRVILWLTRAEREDAEREADLADDHVARTRARRQTAEAGVIAAEVKLDDRRRAQREAQFAPAEALAVGGVREVADKRRAFAETNVKRAEARLREVRAKLAEERTQHGVAHAERAMALTVLAEKRLAEAEALRHAPNHDDLGGAADWLRARAGEHLERAIKDAAQASLERRMAARAEPDPYKSVEGRMSENGDESRREPRKVVKAPYSAKQVVVDAIVAQALLEEAMADDTHPDARQPLLEASLDYLPRADGADDATHLVEPARTAGKRAADAHHRMTSIRAAVAKLEVTPPGGGEEAAADLSGELEMLTLALVSADDAHAALRDGRVGSVAFDPERLRRAHATLGAVRQEAENASAGDWTGFIRRLRPFALAAAKAAHALHALPAIESEREECRADLYRELIDSLAAVSREVEEVRIKEQGKGLPPEIRRATSRTQVLVPLTDKMKEKDADTPEGIQAAKLDAVGRLYDAAQFVWLWKVCKREPDAVVRMAAARRLGEGGAVAFEYVQLDLERILATAKEHEADPYGEKAETALKEIEIDDPRLAYGLMGWLLPVLYTSSGCDARDAGDDGSAASAAAEALLDEWIETAPDLSVAAEVALAEGMRLAANERYLPAEHRAFLTGRAEDLLDRARFWFSKIVLVQARTLWVLSQIDGEDGADTENAEKTIADCCRHAGHPFVREAIDLCVKAVRRQEPANWIWLDERTVTARIGARPAAVQTVGTDEPYWIPPIAGWLSLDRRAQQLLADVVVFLNLLDRRRGSRREELLRKSPPGRRDHDGESADAVGQDSEDRPLPTCLSTRGGRKRLDVARKLDEPVGLSGRCDTSCGMRLCPYPGLGETLSRGEISEAFCRRQYELVKGVWRRRPPWQREASWAELRRFWRAMERRPRA
ncbi:MAG: NACHT domain-containing protein [Actinomycetota bacterium]|nr:NACHT domain-containing protein [Actinomycetota bacterium]